MSVVVALGSNLGDRLAHLRGALAFLPAVKALSPVYESDPVGGPDGQGPYLNAVVLLGAEVSARQAFSAGQRAEVAAGRVRDQRWGPRTLDVDVIAADISIDDHDLTVPHPRAAERAFVLLPWLEVAPDATLNGHPVADLLNGLDCSGLKRTDLQLVRVA